MEFRTRSYIFERKLKLINMKKLIALILLLNIPLLLKGEEPYWIHVQKSNPTTRSIITLPEAQIDRQTDLLTVSFDHSGLYTLYIENSLTETVYQSALPANGMEYRYDLSGIGDGFFTLIINGPGGEYYGEFTL